MTISLPPAMIEQVEAVRKAENRTRSELFREALRTYFSTRFPVVTASKSERAAIRQGRAQIRRGEYVTLDQLLHGLDATRRKTRRKTT
jgi:predicted transcriptional regulator